MDMEAKESREGQLLTLTMLAAREAGLHLK